MAATSDVGMMSDAMSRVGTTPRRPAFPSSSSTRPRAPPSESNIGGPSDDEGEGFADDQVPNKSRRGVGDIPRVEDRLGLTVQESFEDFIEKYGHSQAVLAFVADRGLTYNDNQVCRRPDTDRGTSLQRRDNR